MKILLTISAFASAMWLWRWSMSGSETPAPPAWRAKRDFHHHGSE